MWDLVVIYGLWALHGFVTFLWAHLPTFGATLRTNEQEWILYLQ
jgi:hypothetical protein